MKKLNVKEIALIGMLGALAMVLMLFNFPLPFAPSFLKMDIAELPALFAGFFMGPLAGFLVEVVKILLKLVIQGTDTAYVGELSNLVGSGIFVCLAAAIYKKNKTRKGAIIAMTVSSLLVSVLFIFLNAYVMFPLYVKLYGMPWEAIIGMGAAVNPLITDTVTLMLLAVFPFNIVKHAVTCVITYLVYKKSANALRNIINK